MTSRTHQWWNPFKVVDDVTVIHIDLALNTSREEAAFAWLDQSEQDRWHQFQVDRPRREFALCRAALRANLCDRLGCTNDQLSFGLHQYGKPFAIVSGVPSTASFNVSHSGMHGLIAFAPHGQLGVDVEERVTNCDIDGIGRTVFGWREQSLLANSIGTRKTRMFFTLWTIKEALIKALGTGFSLDPSGFEVPLPMLQGARSSVFRFPHKPATHWRIEDLGETRFAAAIAYELNLKVAT